MHRRLDLVPAFFRLRLGQPVERDFGVAVDPPRDLVVVDRRRSLAQHGLDRDDRLRERDVRQLGRRNHVSDRVHAVDVGAHVPVDDDEAALVDLDLGAVETEAVGERTPAHGDDDGVDRDGVAAGEAHGSALAVAVGLVALHLDAGARIAERLGGGRKSGDVAQP